MALLREGHRCLVGLDEVGRGAWAGPVVAGAVAIPPEVYADSLLLRDADDSKRVHPRRREALAAEVHAVASAAIGWVAPSLMDAVGATQATQLAMHAAVAALASHARDGAIEGVGWHARRTCGPAVTADVLLVDGYALTDAPAPQRAIVRGDRECLSIACASLVAKVARDAYMTAFRRPFPAYGFDRHVGYGTRDHFGALLAHGLTPLHRRRFQPMRHLDLCIGLSFPALPTARLSATKAARNTHGQLGFLNGWDAP
jgi:ribonuclease HII